MSELGSITISIEEDGDENKVKFKTSFSTSDTNLWLDRVKLLLISGDVTEIEE